MLAEPIGDALLRMRDQCTHVTRGGVPEIHHDVGVNVRDLRVANAKSLQTTLIDQPSGADAFDLLEDRSRARVDLEPRVTRATPAQVLLHDAMHDRGVTGGEPKGDRQRDFTSFVQHARVVPELHVRVIGDVPTAALVEQFGGLEHFVDEHRACTVRCGREKMQVLPDRPANRARNADVVFEAGPATSHRLGDQVAHDDATLAPHMAVIGETNVASDISDHEPAEAAVADEDIGAEAEHEKRYAAFASTGHGVCEIIGRRGIVEQVGRTSDAKRGVWP